MAADWSADESALSESGQRAHRRLEEFAGEKIGTRRHVDHLLMLGLLSMGRSGPDAPSGGVVGRRWSSRRKSSLENFSCSQGGLMATKDSKDEGWLTRVRYDH